MFRGCGSNLNLFVLCIFVVVVSGVQRSFWRCTAGQKRSDSVWVRWLFVVWVEVYLCL